MKAAPAGGTGLRAVLLDLDRALVDSRGAWQYALEQAVAATTGRRIDASGLVDEYRRRPWRHALSVVLRTDDDSQRCEKLCSTMFARSAMKRLTVFEGIGMGLDRVRAARIEIGAISREPHALALQQIRSTGIDRFLSVLSATSEGSWDVAARLADCLEFLERPPQRCAYVAAGPEEGARAAEMGFSVVAAGWAEGNVDGSFPVVPTPRELEPVLARLKAV